MSELRQPLMHQQRHRAESFGAIAAEYDAIRPSYPPALIDVLAAGRPDRVLDVGCGTGRAAVLLTARGLNVLGIEVDPEMAAVARGHGITVEVSDFEHWDDGGRRFDLVVSGQAWHWIEPVIGRDVLARVLRPGGRVALFWNSATLAPAQQAVLDAVYRSQAPGLLSSNTGRRDGGPVDAAFAADARFTGVRTAGYRWQRAYTGAEWVRLVQTHSDHVVLDPTQRAELVVALARAIDGLGGRLSASYTTRTVFATRSDVAG